MKKGRKNKASLRSSLDGARFTLPRSKILRGRSNFNRLFSNKAAACESTNISLRFYIGEAGDEPECKMAFIVPKRLGKAVHRNRMKRLLREAYRLNQFIVAKEVDKTACIFHGAFIAKTVEAEYEEIELNVVELLNRVKTRIKNFEP